ncbi:single-stranded DNA-binding protein [Streptomyces sp. NPDC007088]|uniref:single-stranded DNA-binding protein n=1 Tax=Streptomyces sp. NPDC007088 TaxID=3364773 RepID=UPI0036A1C880
MNETLVTVVGNVATTPVFREVPTGALTRFRLAVTARRWDREKQMWLDGHTNFFTVLAWRSLAQNLAASLSVGEPVVVQGRLRVREEERGGQHWTSVDIDAVAVGHDMARGTSAFRRVRRTAEDGRSAAAAEAAGHSGGPGDPVGSLFLTDPTADPTAASTTAPTADEPMGAAPAAEVTGGQEGARASRGASVAAGSAAPAGKRPAARPRRKTAGVAAG